MIISLLRFLGPVSVMFPKLFASVAWWYFCYPYKKSTVNLASFPKPYETRHHSIENKSIVSYRWMPEYYQTVCLLVHGFGGYAGSYRRLIQTCLDNQIAVVACDVKAHGQSSGLTATLADFKSAIQCMLSFDTDIESIVGHSIAGTAAALVLADHEKTPGINRIKQCVLLGSPNRLSSMLQRYLTRLKLDPRCLDLMLEQVSESQLFSNKNLSTSHFLTQQDHADILLCYDRDDMVIPFTDAEEICLENSAVELFETSGVHHRHLCSSSEIIEKVVSTIYEKSIPVSATS